MLHQEVDWLATSILSTGYETGRDKTETVIELTKKLITEVSRLANFPFTQDTLLYHQLLNHIQPLIHRLKRGISLTNPIVEEVKSRYSILYNFVWLASQKVINSESASINSSEVSLLTLYFQVSVERMEKPLSIAVVCPHGLATSELILSVVRKEISPIDRIEKVELDKIEAVQADYDLIISSILLPFDSKKTVLVSSIPLESELRQLKEIYQSLSHRNQGLFISHVKEPEQFIDITIRELLDGRIHYENLKNQEQAFSFLASKCHELNKSNPDFMKSILEREILGSTGVYTGIALPHASPSVVEKSECHLIILKHPIIWGNTLVKVVLLIAIKENEEEIYRDALIHLFSKVDKEEWIESLSKTSKLDETMKLLLEKNEGGI